MATDRKLDERISRWLEAEAPGRLPDRVLQATFERTRGSRQQVGWLALPRRFHMPRSVLALGGAALVVAVALVALTLNNGNQPGIGGRPSPSPSPSPTATPAPSVTAPPPAGDLPEGPFDLEDNGLAMTVTVPAPGWTFDSQFTALVKGPEVANLPEAAMLFWSFPAGTGFYVPADPCQVTSTRPDAPATTVDDLAAALAAQASRDASEPVDVTVGGNAGKSITLHVPDDAVPDECESSEFVSYGTEADPLGRYHQGPGQIDELWIVDVDGGFVIIDAMYRPDTAGELVDELRSIAESATFGE